MSHALPADRLLLASDVARRLGVSASTVLYLERTGQLPALRTVGGTRIFNGDDVERLATARLERRDARARGAA